VDADSRDPPKLTTWVSFMYALMSKGIFIIVCVIRICMVIMIYFLQELCEDC